ncbi:hypothetical protein Pfo_017476 [Paulownia fortunei]|nr:hypothetical protein Pfo_017476 [Paulownia fortunei]
MDSKEATSHTLPETSSGSSYPSSFTSENEKLSKNTISVNDSDNDGSRNGGKGSVSDDEGYLSGKEEFETASNKPVMVGTVGEGIVEGNSDAPFIDASTEAEYLPVSGVVNDDDVEKWNKDVEGEENALEKVSEGGFASDDSKEAKSSGVGALDGEGEILDSMEKLDVNSDEGVVGSGGEIVYSNAGKLVVEEGGKNGDDYEEKGKNESLNSGDEVSEPKVKEAAEVAVIEPEISEVVGHGVSPEGDSVADTIQVDVVAPGVAVVGEMEENGGKKIEGVEVPLEFVGGADESSDSVEEAVSTREGGVDYQSSEPAAENTGDILEAKPHQPENHVVGDGKDEKLGTGAIVDLVNGVHTAITSNGSVDRGGTLDVGNVVKKPEVEYEPAVVSEAIENGITAKIGTHGEVGLDSNAGTQTNDEHAGIQVYNGTSEDVVSKESKWAASAELKAVLDPQEFTAVEDVVDKEVDPEESTSDGDTDGMIFGSSEAAKKFIEELEQGSVGDSHTSADSSFEQSQRIDGQIVTDSEEEGDTDDEGDGKELFDSAALAALLKAATGADSDGGNITITSRDGSRLFSVERPAGLGSSLRALRPAPQPSRPNLFSPTLTNVGVSEDNLSEEEKKKLEKLQQIRVKFLRLVHRLGLSPEESVAAQVLYRLALLGGRQGTQTFSLDAAKRMALQLEAEERDDLDFSVNFLVLGKSGVGKSATINSIFGEEKAPIDAFETGTTSAKEISGFVDGVKVRVVDTPGLKSSVMEQSFNHGVLSSVKKFTNKSPPDVVLYVDRLDAQTRDLNDLPLLKTVTSALGPSIWRSAIVTLTHAASAPPDGPNGTPLSYEVFVTQRSHVVQQSIGLAVGDIRMMSPSLTNSVSLVENHPSCRKNREGLKILPNGQSWRPQLLLLCYSMKILSEASALSKPQEPFDHRKLFGFRVRSPPLPYMLSSMLQSRAHPKLPSDQGADNVDSDIDLDDLSDSDREEEDEYDQLPPFKPLKKAQIAKLSKEQRKAYFEEYDYRVKLLQKKQWREELRRMREIKKKGKDAATDYGFAEDDADSGAAAPVAVPLPDMALPPSFDGDNPAYRYRFLEPTSQFLARPVLDSHGWDHDCGYDGVNLEHSLAIANSFPAAFTVQITKDKKDFSISLDSSISAKHGENVSSMAGFDIQSMGKQLAYIFRGETKIKNLKKNKAAGGISFTVLGENVVPGVKIEDQITLGKQYVLVGSAGAVRSQHDTAFGANFELQRRELDYPIGQVQSTLSMSIIKWRGDLALGFNSLAQFSIGRNSKVAVRAGINNKLSGQVTVRTSSSEHLSLALAAIIPTAISIYKKLWPGAGEKYSIY